MTRFKAAGLHVCLSAAVAVIVAVMVFGVWYPMPYSRFAGGLDLFRLVVLVDVVLGPALTFVIYNAAKPRVELKRDILVIVGLQVCALIYGSAVVFQARPVFLAFEVDRYRVVAASAVRAEELKLASPGFKRLPMWGPKLIGTRRVQSDEVFEASQLALEGYDIGQRPTFWIPYAEVGNAAFLAGQAPEQVHSAGLAQQVAECGIDARAVRLLPLIAREENWFVVVNDRSDVLCFVQSQSGGVG